MTPGCKTHFHFSLYSCLPIYFCLWPMYKISFTDVLYSRPEFKLINVTEELWNIKTQQGMTFYWQEAAITLKMLKFIQNFIDTAVKFWTNGTLPPMLIMCFSSEHFIFWRDGFKIFLYYYCEGVCCSICQPLSRSKWSQEEDLHWYWWLLT